MKLVLISALAFLPVVVEAQKSSSVCLNETPPGVLINICKHERGMAPMPQPKLYLRIYNDGRGEYESHQAWGVLVKKKFRVSDEDVREIARLAAVPDLRNALGRYPVYRRGMDSSRELTVDIYVGTDPKRIILTNFYAADRDNKKHYPASLISLMEKVEELWLKANGIVVKPPSMTFCTLMADREYLIGKRVQIYADMELGREDSYLHDPECDRPEMRNARTAERISFGYDEKKLGKDARIRERVQKKGLQAYDTRIRVMVEGILREETERTGKKYPYRFTIERYLHVDDIVERYAGRLKEGWVYSDTIDHVPGTSLKLSSPLKALIHHAPGIEWTNEDKFPALRRSGRKYLKFRVVSKETRQIERRRWSDVYTCELIEIVEGGENGTFMSGCKHFQPTEL